MRDATTGQVGFVANDGSLRVPRELGASLTALLSNQNLVWARQAEPDGNRGIGALAPLAVALSLDGTEVVSTVAARGRMLGTSLDLRLRTGGGEEVVVPVRTFAGPPVPSTARPTPRTEFTSVYSRASNRVFVIGGKDQLGKPLGDVWWTSPSGGPWAKLEPDGLAPFGEVLSATHSPGDDSLWVLDRVRGFGGHLRRIQKIDSTTGSATLVGVWPELGLFSRHWLVQDHDGGVLLFGTSERLGRHIAVRFSTTAAGQVVVDSLQASDGHLAFEPTVDPHGYTFTFRKPNKKYAVVRQAELERKTAAWWQVGGCW